MTFTGFVFNNNLGLEQVEQVTNVPYIMSLMVLKYMLYLYIKERRRYKMCILDSLKTKLEDSGLVTHNLHMLVFTIAVIDLEHLFFRHVY